MKRLDEENRRNITVVGVSGVHRIELLLLLHVPSIKLVIPSPTGDSNMSLAIGVSIRVMHLVPLAPHSARSAKALIHQLLVTLTPEVQLFDEGQRAFIKSDSYLGNGLVELAALS